MGDRFPFIYQNSFKKTIYQNIIYCIITVHIKTVFENVVVVAFQSVFHSEKHANNIFLFFKNHF